MVVESGALAGEEGSDTSGEGRGVRFGLVYLEPRWANKMLVKAGSTETHCTVNPAVIWVIVVN